MRGRTFSPAATARIVERNSPMDAAFSTNPVIPAFTRLRIPGSNGISPNMISLASG
jgi:hypothetical protein